MTKTISLKLLFVIAFALFAIFAAQFVFTPALAQAPENLSAVPPASVKSVDPPPTAAELTQIEKAAKALPAVFVFSEENIKVILALSVDATAQVRVLEQTTGVLVPVIFEKNENKKYGTVFCGYFPEISVNAKPAPRIAIMRSSLAAQILDAFRGGKPSIVLFDPVKYPTSFGCLRNLTATAPVLLSTSLSFPAPIVSSVLAQSGAELVAQARKTATCPPNTQARVRNIETVCAKQKNAAGCRDARYAALRAQFAKSLKTANCDLPGLIPVSPTTSVAPGRPRPGTPGSDTAVLPTPPPPSGGTPAASLDFGDAPPNFFTRLSANGPRHVLSNRVWFGLLIDPELDGLPTDQDDVVGLDDEDGMLASNPQFIFRVRTGPAVAPTVYVNALEDWNANGRWDINANGAPGDEWIVRNFPLTNMRPNTSRDVALTQPRNGPNGQPLPAAWSDLAFWVRFVVTETPVPSGNIRGQFPSGETEDYIGVAPPAPSAPTPTPAPAPAPAPAKGNGAAGAAAGH